MPSATHGPATAPISAMGVSRRMVNSSPSWASIFSYSWAVFFAVGDAPVDAAIASGRGARLSNGLAFSGRKPTGRSASSSTRCSTPMVSFLPHTGHRPPRAAVSTGVRHTPQLRWPSRWYLPSSGKNSIVPKKPSPVRIARISEGYSRSPSMRFASRPSFDGECASEFETSVSPSSADTRQFIGGSEDRPVSTAWMCGVRSSKQSSIVSKPENAPNMEKCGVQMCAGMNSASGQASSVSSSRSRLSRPRMGRPSDRMLPMASSRAASSSAASRLGRRITLCTLRVLPWRL